MVSRDEVEKKLESPLDDSVWELHGHEIEAATLTDAIIIVLQVLQGALNAEKTRANALQTMLNNQSAERKRKAETQFLVLSVSEAAKDSTTVENFRENQVGQELCRGGFVCHPLYIEFVKAARAMAKIDASAQEPNSARHSTQIDSRFRDVEEELTVTASLLGNRAERSLFSTSYTDEEGPQSAIAAELLRLALTKLGGKGGDDFEIKVTHQYQVVSSVLQDDPNIEVIKKPKPLSSNENKAKAKPSKKKTDDRVDVLAWFVRAEDNLGACALAAVEYKPSNIREGEREAQADMYASNIHVLHRKPCIDINISGGNDISRWRISAYALAPRPTEWRHDGAKHNWDKAPMYSGLGITGIVRVAAGLLAAFPHFPRELNAFGSRLGPVVGCHNDSVFKAYDDASSRKPNIKFVRQLLDEHAVMWQSQDKNLVVVETKKFPNNWKENVTTMAFISILKKLLELHKTSPHGDIRLANLLSSGYIVDFDFVGAAKYPKGLNDISKDGRRHPEVVTAIGRKKIGEMKPKKSHDYFSMMKVMELFGSKNEEKTGAWVKATELVGGGNIVDAVSCLEKEFCLNLLDPTIPLSGTGATPKKQPDKMESVTNCRPNHYL